MNLPSEHTKYLPDEGTNSSTTSSKSQRNDEDMESKILAFLDKNGVQIAIPSEYLKRNHLEKINNTEKTPRELVKRLSLSCPLFIKRKSKNFLK